MIVDKAGDEFLEILFGKSDVFQEGTEFALAHRYSVCLPELFQWGMVEV